MFANYLKVALRALLRHKGHAALNVVGLAVGLACCILLFLYVHHAWTYDRAGLLALADMTSPGKTVIMRYSLQMLSEPRKPSRN